LKRTVETTAIVKDRHTVVLGGLIDDQIDHTKYRVPCLGEIPGLGFLFSQKANTNDKTNLYVFLTPRVIQNPDEATEVSKEKRGHIDKIREENIKLYHGGPAKETSQATPNPSLASFQYQEQQEPLPAQEPQTQPAATDAAASPAPGDNHDQPTPSIQTSAKSDGGYTVQVASVPSIQEADQILKKLNDLGYGAYTVQSSESDKTRFLVRIGFFKQRRSAGQLIDRLKSDRYDPILIKI
jgi:general secretion pathway protein D